MRTPKLDKLENPRELRIISTKKHANLYKIVDGNGKQVIDVLYSTIGLAESHLEMLLLADMENTKKDTKKK